MYQKGNPIESTVLKQKKGRHFQNGAQRRPKPRLRVLRTPSTRWLCCLPAGLSPQRPDRCTLAAPTRPWRPAQIGPSEPVFVRHTHSSTKRTSTVRLKHEFLGESDSFGEWLVAFDRTEHKFQKHTLWNSWNKNGGSRWKKRHVWWYYGLFVFSFF